MLLRPPDLSIQEFRDLWQESYGVALDYEMARREAEKLLAVLDPAFLPKDNSPPD